MGLIIPIEVSFSSMGLGEELSSELLHRLMHSGCIMLSSAASSVLRIERMRLLLERFLKCYFQNNLFDTRYC